MKDIFTEKGSTSANIPPEDRPSLEPEKERSGGKKRWIIIGATAVIVGGLLWYFLSRPNLSDQIVLPYISHQKPAIDPHLPSTNALADKLDEVQFDGLFNLTASPSGVVYEDGLGEFVSIDENNVVTIQLKTSVRWHDSWQ